MAKVQAPPPRMAPRLANGSPPPIPHVYYDDPTKTKKAVAKVAKKRQVTLVSKAPVDDQFTCRVLFSPAFGDNAGATYSEPLQIDDAAAAASQPFYWRAEIDQFRVDPLLQGFETRWDILTAGWTFIDGLGPVIYDEAISNPLKITRVIRAPASIATSPKFKVVVTKKYRP